MLEHDAVLAGRAARPVQEVGLRPASYRRRHAIYIHRPARPMRRQPRSAAAPSRRLSHRLRA
ncbi:hypothetical protein, partial [Bordetella pertussis]|uniref:hypothetical protein n=1 Tax=Bordetella pertussis TaxID=520 RepID=UPI001C92CA2F